MTSIVALRGDRLSHEHISWDQATVLSQLGLLPTYVPFPYPIASKNGKLVGKEDAAKEGAKEGESEQEGRKYEVRIPVLGADTARKLVEEGSVESNALIYSKGSVRVVSG
jgi:carboxymethylenebutenolidase